MNKKMCIAWSATMLGGVFVVATACGGGTNGSTSGYPTGAVVAGGGDLPATTGVGVFYNSGAGTGFNALASSGSGATSTGVGASVVSSSVSGYGYTSGIAAVTSGGPSTVGAGGAAQTGTTSVSSGVSIGPDGGL